MLLPVLLDSGGELQMLLPHVAVEVSEMSPFALSVAVGNFDPGNTSYAREMLHYTLQVVTREILHCVFSVGQRCCFLIMFLFVWPVWDG